MDLNSNPDTVVHKALVFESEGKIVVCFNYKPKLSWGKKGTTIKDFLKDGKKYKMDMLIFNPEDNLLTKEQTSE